MATLEISATPVRHKGRSVPLRLIVPCVIVAIFILGAIVSPLVAPYNASQVTITQRLLPPGAHLSSGQIAWLGTDQLGRSMLSEILAGARVSFAIVAASILVSGISGLILGTLAGYFGGWFDALIMRIGDVQLAFPSILLAILLSGALGQSVLNVIIALAVSRWIVYARVVRGSVISVRGRPYVESAKVIGASTWRILLRYVLPATIAPALVLSTVEVGFMVIAEASLSFLGLGVPVNDASWGSTISNGQDYLNSAWWVSTLPGVALAIVVVCVGLIGQYWRETTNVAVA